MSSPTFRLRDVGVEYDDHHALSGIELDIRPGEIVALVGPSGAGKTTLLRLLNGTLHPSRGTVEFEGLDLARIRTRELRRVRGRVGFVHQNHSLVPNVRVASNVIAGKLGQRSFASSMRSMLWPSRPDLEQAYGLLERVGIADKLFQRTDTLSGGQQQRVALVRALFQEPAALLADEPVASVDPTRARDMITLLIDVVREHGLTLVTSLHDRELAREFFPRVVGLRGGRLFFDRQADQIQPDDFRQLYALEESAHA